MRESRVSQGLKLSQPVGAVDANPFYHGQSPFAALEVERWPADSSRPHRGVAKPLSHKPLSATSADSAGRGATFSELGT